jgi:putative membrane protein
MRALVGVVASFLVGHVEVFFLACVTVAGLFGAATVSVRILLAQAVPALLALVAVLVAW